MPGKFKDYTGAKFGDWRVIRAERTEKNRPTLWLAKHKCGHEQVLRIDQLKMNRDSLCGNCGEYNRRTAAARVASAIAARTPKAKNGPGLMESIDSTREAAKQILDRQGLLAQPKQPTRRYIRRKLSAWEYGLEQAKAFAKFNFV